MTQCITDNKSIPQAKRYSAALLEVAQNKNEIDEVYSDLSNIVDLLNNKTELNNFSEFLSHPAIPASDKKELVKSVFEGKINADTLNLLYILAEKNNIGLVPSILACYEEEVDKVKNILKVTVISAIKLDKKTVSKLQEKLESRLQKTVKFDFEVNPEIIAGIVLKINDKTIDGSMISKLNGFKKMLGN